MAADRITIDSIPVSCIVGILPDERVRTQPLVLTFEATLDVTEAAVTGALSRTFDYAAMAQELTFILEAGCFRLLETAALALCSYAFARPGVALTSVSVRIAKPMALEGKGVPTVTLVRTPSQLPGLRRATGGLVFRAPDAVIRLLSAATSSPDVGFPNQKTLTTAFGLSLRVAIP